jgi:hypothetical protein
MPTFRVPPKVTIEVSIHDIEIPAPVALRETFYESHHTNFSLVSHPRQIPGPVSSASSSSKRVGQRSKGDHPHRNSNSAYCWIGPTQCGP